MIQQDYAPREGADEYRARGLVEAAMRSTSRLALTRSAPFFCALALSVRVLAACSADASSPSDSREDGGTASEEDGGTTTDVDGASSDDAPSTPETCASCKLPHATSECARGACAVVACESGFADCDGNAKNGCEASLATADHCGSCAKRCVPPPNGASSCNASVCEPSCNAGFLACAQGCCLPPSQAPRLEAGDRVTCYVGATGGLKCWGKGGAGQLGNNTTTAIQKAPVDVVGLTTGVRTVSVGRTHACAVTTTGAVKCWGGNSYGQLGVATPAVSLVPVDVTGLASGYDRVSAGHVFSCALSLTGGVKCWGDNAAGALGDGTTTIRKTPVDVSGLGAGVVSVATGYSHACALTSTGGVKCWGSGSTNTTPADVPSLTSGVSAIATGQSTSCAVLTGGNVMCWGAARPYAPAVVAGVSGAVAVTADYTHSCARLSTGGVKCWGGNGYGQLGNTSNGTSPVDVQGLTSGVAEVSAGDWHTCAVTTTGVVKCWGWNAEGQLGPNASAPQSAVPIDVAGL